MRINSVEQKGYANGIMDWKIFVRQDLVVAKASEFFYEFVGENSFRPVSELLLPEDGELLKKSSGGGYVPTAGTDHGASQSEGQCKECVSASGTE